MNFGSISFVILITLFCLFQCPVNSTLGKSDKKSKKPAPKKKTEKPKTNLSIEDDLFNQINLSPDHILANYDELDVNASKKFPNPVLAYVTPWNNRGYDVAKLVSKKFTHVSPVWFQIMPHRDGCSIGGTHDMDQGWIEQIRLNNPDIKLVPRFLFDKWTPDRYNAFLTDQNEQNACIKIVLNFIKRNRFNGLVLEIWTNVISTFKNFDIKRPLIDTIINMAEQLSSPEEREFILVVPPLHPGTEMQMFTADDLETVAPYVTYFSVMTYDFPSDKPVGVAPIQWIHDCLVHLTSSVDQEVRHKLLMGLNFYGYDYSQSAVTPIIGNKYIELLKKHKPKIQWNEKSSEHFIQYENHITYFPTYVSILWRLKLARELGVGVAIWEIGQGLNNFYNML